MNLPVLEGYTDSALTDLIDQEIRARAELPLSPQLRMYLIASAAQEIMHALLEGHEWVGARGGLQFDPTTSDGGWS